MSKQSWRVSPTHPCLRRGRGERKVGPPPIGRCSGIKPTWVGQEHSQMTAPETGWRTKAGAELMAPQVLGADTAGRLLRTVQAHKPVTPFMLKCRSLAARRVLTNSLPLHLCSAFLYVDSTSHSVFPRASGLILQAPNAAEVRASLRPPPAPHDQPEIGLP